MIYGVSRSKREGLGYSQKTFNLRFETLTKPENPSSSSSGEKGFDSYCILAVENAKILVQLEPKAVESKVLKKPKPKILKSKVLKKP